MGHGQGGEQAVPEPDPVDQRGGAAPGHEHLLPAVGIRGACREEGDRAEEVPLGEVAALEVVDHDPAVFRSDHALGGAVACRGPRASEMAGGADHGLGFELSGAAGETGYPQPVRPACQREPTVARNGDPSAKRPNTPVSGEESSG